MASRNFYLQLIFSVILIALTALLLAWSIVNRWYFTLGLTVILMIAQVHTLIRFINRTKP